jgi:hypothetical protein
VWSFDDALVEALSLGGGGVGDNGRRRHQNGRGHGHRRADGRADGISSRRQPPPDVLLRRTDKAFGFAPCMPCVYY